MLDGKPARSHGAYTSIRTPRTPSRPPSVCLPPSPEEVHERIHDRVFKYLYKHADFLIPFDVYTREIYRSLLGSTPPIDLTVYPETFGPTDDDPFVALRSASERSMTNTKQTVWSLTWDRLELPVQGRDLVLKAVEVTSQKGPAACQQLLREALPDPLPLHLRPLEPILSRRELITSASLSTTRSLPVPFRRAQLFDDGGKYSIGRRLSIEVVDDRGVNEAHALNMELQVEDDLKRSAKLWRQGMADKVHNLIKERRPLGEARQWDEWRRKDAIRLAEAPKPLSPPLFPRRYMTHLPTGPFSYAHLRLESLRGPVEDALPVLPQLMEEAKGLTFGSVVKMLKASTITDEEAHWRLADPLRLELLDDFDGLPLQPLTPTTEGSRTPSSRSSARAPGIDMQTCLTPSRNARLRETDIDGVYYPTPFSHRQHRASARPRGRIRADHLPPDAWFDAPVHTQREPNTPLSPLKRGTPPSRSSECVDGPSAGPSHMSAMETQQKYMQSGTSGILKTPDMAVAPSARTISCPTTHSDSPGSMRVLNRLSVSSAQPYRPHQAIGPTQASYELLELRTRDTANQISWRPRATDSETAHDIVQRGPGAAKNQMGSDQHIPHSPQDPSTPAHLIRAIHSRLASHNLYSPEVTQTDRPETSRFPDENLLEGDNEAQSEILLQLTRENSSHWQDPDVEIIDVAQTDEGPFWGEHTAEIVGEGSSPWEVFSAQKHQSALDAIEPGDNGEEYQAGCEDDHPHHPTDDYGAPENTDYGREWYTASDERIHTEASDDKADSGHEYDYGSGSQDGGLSLKSEISAGEGPAYAAEVSRSWHKQAVPNVRSRWSTDDTLQGAGTVDAAPAWNAADMGEVSDFGPAAEDYDMDHVQSGVGNNPDWTWEDEQGVTAFGAGGTRPSHHEPWYDQLNDGFAGQPESPYIPDDAQQLDQGACNHDVSMYLGFFDGGCGEEFVAGDDRMRLRPQRGDWVHHERAEHEAVDSFTLPVGVDSITFTESPLYHGNAEENYESIGYREDVVPLHGYEHADPQMCLAGAEQDTAADFDQRYAEGNALEYEPSHMQAWEHEYGNEDSDALDQGRQQRQVYAPEDEVEYELELDPLFRSPIATITEQGIDARNEEWRARSTHELDPWRGAGPDESSHTPVADVNRHSPRSTDLRDSAHDQSEDQRRFFQADLSLGLSGQALPQTHWDLNHIIPRRDQDQSRLSESANDVIHQEQCQISERAHDALASIGCDEPSGAVESAETELIDSQLDMGTCLEPIKAQRPRPQPTMSFSTRSEHGFKLLSVSQEQRQPATLVAEVKKRKTPPTQADPPRSFEALCAASNPTSTELGLGEKSLKRAKLSAISHIGDCKTLDDVVREQHPTCAGDAVRTNGNDVGKQARNFFAAVHLPVSSPPDSPNESAPTQVIKPKTEVVYRKPARRMNDEWRNDSTIRNPAWWKSLAQNARDDLEKVSVLVDISVRRNRSLARALNKAFELVERSTETHAGSQEAAMLGSSVLRYGWLQGADLVLSATTAVVFYSMTAVTTTLNEIVTRLVGTTRYYRRVLVIFEMVDYHTHLQVGETDRHSNPLSADLLQAVPKLRRAIIGSLAGAELEANVELIFACDGPAQLTRLLRKSLEEEFVELREAYGDARVSDACEGRGEWLSLDESEQCVLVRLSLELNAFACGYIIHKASSIDSFVFDCTAKDRIELVEHVLGWKEMDRVNRLIAGRLRDMNLSSGSSSPGKPETLRAEEANSEAVKNLMADVSVEELDDYDLSD